MRGVPSSKNGLLRCASKDGFGLLPSFPSASCQAGNSGILAHKPWREPGRCKRGKNVVPAIVILIILAAGGGAWLGYRAGYRRGWLARDTQGPQDGQA
jgi:hypothetical protein